MAGDARQRDLNIAEARQRRSRRDAPDGAAQGAPLMEMPTRSPSVCCRGEIARLGSRGPARSSPYTAAPSTAGASSSAAHERLRLSARPPSGLASQRSRARARRCGRAGPRRCADPEALVSRRAEPAVASRGTSAGRREPARERGGSLRGEPVRRRRGRPGATRARNRVAVLVDPRTSGRACARPPPRARCRSTRDEGSPGDSGSSPPRCRLHDARTGPGARRAADARGGHDAQHRGGVEGTRHAATQRAAAHSVAPPATASATGPPPPPRVSAREAGRPRSPPPRVAGRSAAAAVTTRRSAPPPGGDTRGGRPGRWRPRPANAATARRRGASAARSRATESVIAARRAVSTTCPASALRYRRAAHGEQPGGTPPRSNAARTRSPSAPRAHGVPPAARGRLGTGSATVGPPAATPTVPRGAHERAAPAQEGGAPSRRSRSARGLSSASSAAPDRRQQLGQHRFGARLADRVGEGGGQVLELVEDRGRGAAQVARAAGGGHEGPERLRRRGERAAHVSRPRAFRIASSRAFASGSPSSGK